MSRATFRPLGVPNVLAERVLKDPLDKETILRVSNGNPVMCVLIKDHVTKDGRGGYHLADVPSNKTIEERMVRSWDLGRNIEVWKQNADKTPSILIALSGPINHRMIVASVAIDRDPARFSQISGSRLFQVPVAAEEENENLDFKGLRGRRVGQGVTKFSNLRSELFFIIEPAATGG